MASSIQHSLVKVYWEGPLDISAAFKKKGRRDRGLYQVYGDHPVFGPHSLLYVGRTDQQSFGMAFVQHYERWMKHDSGVTIHLGTFRDHGASVLVKEVEALTILWHSPPYNSKGIWVYGGPPVRVQNHDSRGRLLAEYSSHWRPDRIPPDGE